MRPVSPALVAAALALLPVAALAVPQAGQPAPPFSLNAPDGKPVALGAFKGKPLYINFFASWCGPCNDEAPAIEKFREKYASRGLQIMGINELDAPGQALAFEKKYHAPYSVVAVDGDGAVGKTYGALGLPVHVFVDRRGVVSTYRIGQMTDAEIETAIKGALK